MRFCPDCWAPLHPYLHAETELDICRRCAGVFLDPGEASQTYGDIAEPSRWREQKLAQHLGLSSRACPARHLGQPATMHRYRLVAAATSVEVDACGHCRGLWLAAGAGEQLAQIAKHASFDAAARKAERDAAALPDKPTETVLVDGPPHAGWYLLQLLGGFPSEIGHPTRHPVWLVPTLVIVMLAIAAVQLVTGPAGFAGGMMVPTDILAGHNLITLLSHSLLHADLHHVASNAYFFYVFGDNLEDHLGAPWFAVLVVFSLLSGAGLHLLACKDPTLPVLGASGAVSGLMGAYAVLFPHVRVLVMRPLPFQMNVLWYVGLWLGLQFVMQLMDVGGIAWIVHIGGFAGGAFLALVFRELGVHERPTRA